MRIDGQAGGREAKDAVGFLKRSNVRTLSKKIKNAKKCMRSFALISGAKMTSIPDRSKRTMLRNMPTRFYAFSTLKRLVV